MNRVRFTGLTILDISVRYAGVAKLVDALGLGPSEATLGGSNPSIRRMFKF